MKDQNAKNDWAKSVSTIVGEIVNLVADREVQDRPHFATVILSEMVDKKEVGQDQLLEIFSALATAGIVLSDEQRGSLTKPAGDDATYAAIEKVLSEETTGGLLRQRNVVVLGAVIGAGGVAIKTGVNAGSVTGAIVSVVGSYFAGNLVEAKMPKFENKALNVATALTSGLVIGAGGTVAGDFLGGKISEWKETRNEEQAVTPAE